MYVSGWFAAGAVIRGYRLITSTQIGVFLMQWPVNVFYFLFPCQQLQRKRKIKLLRGVHMLWAEMVSKPENLIQFILAEEELSICVNICHSMAPCFH